MGLLSDWLFGKEAIYRKQLDALKAECADLKAPRVVYAEPDKDMTHDWNENDVLALELKRDQERKDTPRIVQMPVRGTVR
jgi:hypothetical protein